MVDFKKRSTSANGNSGVLGSPILLKTSGNSLKTWSVHISGSRLFGRVISAMDTDTASPPVAFLMTPAMILTVPAVKSGPPFGRDLPSTGNNLASLK
ncbi:Protein of unknown function [Pyronema omphalodes CBS 100304]|uniref:Uncharacterized protein n=1 Tax=Pyronema omphalodes (strain CBS 100304) TaxID=1076935 RepID=U4LRN6_PYROM|nr:Protein of unknown function [Pyronema omphalodes CBS 100304]